MYNKTETISRLSYQAKYLKYKNKYLKIYDRSDSRLSSLIKEMRKNMIWLHYVWWYIDNTIKLIRNSPEYSQKHSDFMTNLMSDNFDFEKEVIQDKKKYVGKGTPIDIRIKL
jgi:hypothetical protein